MVGSISSRGLVAACAFVASVCVSSMASAQGLIDFLWGGDEEHGGQRQVVTLAKSYPVGQVIVSFGDRRLYLITKPGTAISYPIAVPREQSRWQGNTTVSSKRENPDWTPTPDMFKENPKLPSWVPGGHPMNPLGVRALYLGSSTYRIHGTDAPWTIGQAVSKGCIRMFNEDVLDLYPRVPIGSKVIVTWDKFKTEASNEQIAAVAVTGKGGNSSSTGSQSQSTTTPEAASSSSANGSTGTTSAKPRVNASYKQAYAPLVQTLAGSPDESDVGSAMSPSFTSTSPAESKEAKSAAASSPEAAAKRAGIPVDSTGRPKAGFFVFPEDTARSKSEKTSGEKSSGDKTGRDKSGAEQSSSSEKSSDPSSVSIAQEEAVAAKFGRKVGAGAVAANATVH